MQSEKKNLLRTLEIKICFLKILSKTLLYPWNYFFLGKEYLKMDEPLKAARNFTKAGKIMATKGYRSLTESTYKEAKEVYQNLQIKNPSILERKDYANLGRIDAFLDPFPDKDTMIFCKYTYFETSTLWKK